MTISKAEGSLKTATFVPASADRQHLAQSEMFDLPQGAGDDPRRRDNAGRGRYVKSPPSVAAIKAVVRAMGMTPRALPPQERALRGTGSGRCRSPRRRVDRGHA